MSPQVGPAKNLLLINHFGYASAKKPLRFPGAVFENSN